MRELDNEELDQVSGGYDRGSWIITAGPNYNMDFFTQQLRNATVGDGSTTLAGAALEGSEYCS